VNAAKFAGVDYSTIRKPLHSVAIKLGMESVKELVLMYGAPKPKKHKHERIRKRRGVPLVQQIIGILAKQEYRCALSGVPLIPESSTLDHKHPISLGGTDDIENLQWLHVDVNRAKGNMPHEDFVLMCKRVATWNG
jgi:5-methylcytosine-specific restriction endonuclease McrA